MGCLGWKERRIALCVLLADRSPCGSTSGQCRIVQDGGTTSSHSSPHQPDYRGPLLSDEITMSRGNIVDPFTTVRRGPMPNDPHGSGARHTASSPQSGHLTGSPLCRHTPGSPLFGTTAFAELVRTTLAGQVPASEALGPTSSTRRNFVRDIHFQRQRPLLIRDRTRRRRSKQRRGVD